MEVDDFPDNERRKKTKFGRGSGQWRFAERTPSPVNEVSCEKIDDETPFKQHSHPSLAAAPSGDDEVAETSDEQEKPSRPQPPQWSTPNRDDQVASDTNLPAEADLASERHIPGEHVDADRSSSAAQEDIEIFNNATSTESTNRHEKKPPEKVDIPPTVDTEPTDISENTPLVEAAAQNLAQQHHEAVTKSPSKPTESIGHSTPASIISIGSSSVSSSGSEGSEEAEGASLPTGFEEEAGRRPSQDFGFDGSVFSKTQKASSPRFVHDKTEETEDLPVADAREESTTEETKSVEDESVDELKDADPYDKGLHDMKIGSNHRANQERSSMPLHPFDQTEHFELPDKVILSTQRPLDTQLMSAQDTSARPDSHLDSTNLLGVAAAQDQISGQQLHAVSLDSISYPALPDEGPRKGHETAKPAQQTSIEVIDLESEAEEDQLLGLVAKAESVASTSESVSQPKVLLLQNDDIPKSPSRQEEPDYRGTIDREETTTHATPADVAIIQPPWVVNRSGNGDGSLNEAAGEFQLERTVPENEGQIEDLVIDSEIGDTTLTNDSAAVHTLLPSHVKNDTSQPLIELPSTVPDSAAPPLQEQLPTPSTTQKTTFVSEPSTVSLKSVTETDTLPTPRLTQGISTGIEAPSSPAFSASAGQIQVDDEHQGERLSPLLSEASNKPTSSPPSISPITPIKKRSALVEKLRAIRRTSQNSPRARLSNSVNAASPWFAPKRSSQVVPDSEADSGFSESAEEVEKLTPRKPPSVLATPEKLPANTFIRSSPGENDAASLASTQYVPPSQPATGGLRTNLSYFVPLAALPSHFGTNTDTLAVVITSSSIARALSGPRDFTQSLYITDYSFNKSKNPITTAQIFRPNRVCFPEAQPGDAILLRNFKVQSYRKRISLLSTETSAWVVFREGVEPQVSGPPIEYGAEERAFARGHWKWWGSLDQDERARMHAAVPEQVVQKTSGRVKLKREGINGMGIELPGSQEAKNRAKKSDEWSTQALAKEWTVGINGLESHGRESEMLVTGRRGLRPRNARGKTMSESPEKDNPLPKNGKMVVKHVLRDGTKYVDDDSGNVANEKKAGLSVHELRDGTKYKDRR